jgi:hypothetical protein
MKGMEPELFWSVAFGPVNSLIKFHFEGNAYTKENFKITESNYRRLFEMVISALGS